MRFIPRVVLLLIFDSLFGQYIAFEPIDESLITNWKTESSVKEYEGVYQFGLSEDESSLVLFTAGEEVIAQIQSGGWNEDATAWKWTYENLESASIDPEGNFKSKSYTGKFVLYEEDKKKIKCLRINNPWSAGLQKDEYELGWKSGEINTMYAGDYPQASTKILETSYLEKLTSKELKIMRNEIFARYGYIFKEGGAMETYFKSLDWYEPQHSNVSNFLTSIEKRNIEQIRKMENVS